MQDNNYPKLHNASWPGIVGKGQDSEPIISFDEMLQFTAAAEVDGVKFDGIDIGLFNPHFDIDSDNDGIKNLADKVSGLHLDIGSLVAPIWPPTGGSAMGTKEERDRFVDQVRKASSIGKTLRELGVRPHGVIRIDSATDPLTWAKDPKANTKLMAETFREACDVAADYGERLAMEGEICWGGMHSWRAMVETLEAVKRPNIGFQADMAHTLLYLLGYNSPEDRILPEDFDWNDREALNEGLKSLPPHFVPGPSTSMLRRTTAPFTELVHMIKRVVIVLLPIQTENWIFHTMLAIGCVMKTAYLQKHLNISAGTDACSPMK